MTSTWLRAVWQTGLLHVPQRRTFSRCRTRCTRKRSHWVWCLSSEPGTTPGPSRYSLSLEPLLPVPLTKQIRFSIFNLVWRIWIFPILMPLFRADSHFFCLSTFCLCLLCLCVLLTGQEMRRLWSPQSWASTLPVSSKNCSLSIWTRFTSLYFCYPVICASWWLLFWFCVLWCQCQWPLTPLLSYCCWSPVLQQYLLLNQDWDLCRFVSIKVLQYLHGNESVSSLCWNVSCWL